MQRVIMSNARVDAAQQHGSLTPQAFSQFSADGPRLSRPSQKWRLQLNYAERKPTDEHTSLFLLDLR